MDTADFMKESDVFINVEKRDSHHFISIQIQSS